MTEHYHCLPITPNSLLFELAGCSFMCSFGTTARAQADLAESIAERMAYDCGSFTLWLQARKEIERLRAAGVIVSADKETEMMMEARVDHVAYYAWIKDRLRRPTSWAIVPDIIEAPAQEQDALLKTWPFERSKGAPVYHMHHGIYRLLQLCEQGWNRICIGSAGEYRDPLSEAWMRRMDEMFEALETTFGDIPMLHLLRGLGVFTSGQCRWPIGSGDASNLGRNHNRLTAAEGSMVISPGDKPEAVWRKIRRINAAQAPGTWIAPVGRQPDLYEGEAA